MTEWILVVIVLWTQSGGLAPDWVEPMKNEVECLEAEAKWPEHRQVYNTLGFATTLGEARCWPRAYYEGALPIGDYEWE